MKVKRREMIALCSLAVVLAGVLYYYLFFSNYLVERVTMREENAAAQEALDIASERISRLDEIKAELEDAQAAADNLMVKNLIETGDLVVKITSVCTGIAENVSVSLSDPSNLGETDDFYVVSASVSFSTVFENVAGLLESMEQIDICNRIMSGSISFPSGDNDMCSVSLTAEFLYSTNIFTAPREDTEDETVQTG